MKKLYLLLAIFLAAFTVSAQECGSYIELKGAGMHGLTQMSMDVDQPGKVISIIAETIYKGSELPTKVKFWSEFEEMEVEGVDVPISGFQPDGVITQVFRDTFKIAAGTIHLDILDNESGFYSMSLYIEREATGVTSYMAGDLYHVFQNEDDPLVIEIPLEMVEEPRDIGIRFGITELNADERWALFTFEADGEVKSVEVWEWNAGEGETESFTIEEVLFEQVDPEVDKIVMTMLSENYENGVRTGDSFIAGVVVVDTPCEPWTPESGMICSYTQGFYGNEGGKTCSGLTTPEVLEILMQEELVMGKGEHSLTIAAGGVDCILDMLPGGGPSKVLNGIYDCDNMGDLVKKNKSELNNTLLAQGITLSLNMRLSPTLETFPMTAEFIAADIHDCNMPLPSLLEGTLSRLDFSEAIIEYLGEEAFIGDLLELVNLALAGEDISPLSLSEVSDAATLVNEAFDECKAISLEILPEFENEEVELLGAGLIIEDDGEMSATGMDQEDIASLHVYPNPAGEFLQISLEAEMGEVNTVALYNMSGQTVLTAPVEDTFNKVLKIELGDLESGFYLLRMETSSGMYSTRVNVR